MGGGALPTKKVGALLIWEAADMSHACGHTVGTVTEGRERAGAAAAPSGARSSLIPYRPLLGLRVVVTDRLASMRSLVFYMLYTSVFADTAPAQRHTCRITPQVARIT